MALAHQVTDERALCRFSAVELRANEFTQNPTYRLVDRLEQLIEQAAQDEQRLTEAEARPQHFEVQSSAGTIG